ncbi:hypothetical protein FA13DRAFT_46805 [Coprinellus micaceus]|uniref:Uncharacterized protein n=1 Tax=Coprinellus micaceus TaxID=71717 RepID=A0A4Y7U2D8_COPMI|nr:hypothetical protein FA13DRAFT_46805 [Coprinellus micaceus]
MYVPQRILVQAVGGVGVSTRLAKASGKLLLNGSGSREGWEWMKWVVLGIRDLISKFAELIAQWVGWLASTLQSIFSDPGAWLVHLLESCYAILCNHPHLVCVISLCLFAGPVVVLLPFLLLHEIAILVLFNLNFVGHGLLPGRIEDQYDALKEHFMESRERTFDSVDAATSTFNQWTTDHFFLRLLRILGGVIDLLVQFDSMESERCGLDESVRWLIPTIHSLRLELWAPA